MTVSVGTIAQIALRRLGVRIVPLDDSPVLTEMVAFDVIAIGALIELGVIASDETPADADMTYMRDKVASVHAALDAQGVVWWPVGSVPRAFVEEYTKLTAAQGASSFGQPADPAIVAMLEARVRKGAMVLSSDTKAQEAVQDVHSDLVMRGIARWSIQDIPTPLADPYATLAADALAPLFGGDTDPNDTLMAITSIYRYVALPSSGEQVSVAYF